MKVLNFEVTKSVVVDELQCTVTELVHEKSGATVLHIGNDDDENLFNLSFATHPRSSNGVAHILEHTVLCGSKKYPIPDPFFEMTRRSLNTFMNALTGPDFTCYPASSMVKRDFYNLLDVYIDSVFHPLLLKESFLQEGHRLEFSKKEDPSSPLTFQGIVFNEMKGALASGEARLNEFMMSALFPDLTYGINSGGEPPEIVNLSYEELKAFHEEFYHPSRCLYYFYGNIPLEEHLGYLEKRILKDVKRVDPIPVIPKQSRFDEPHYVTKTYPVAENEKSEEKSFFSIGCLTCSILDQEELLALNVLDIALTGTDASPLKSALLRSGLCKQADSFIDNEMSEVPFVLICKGCGENSGEAIARLTRETLINVMEEGLPDNVIEGAIHQLEMSRTEIGSNHTPFGLSLFFRSGLLKQHGGNPEDGLRIHTLFNKLRSKVKEKGYLASLIDKYFINNPHRVYLTLLPDQKMGKEEEDIEQERLVEIEKKLTQVQRSAIVADSKKLLEIQESEKETDVLPKVSLDDVSYKEKEFELQREEGSITLYHHNCFTNGFLYADLVYTLPAIAEEDLSFLRLFTILLPQMGCGGRDYREHLDYLMEYTGGISFSLDLNAQDENPKQIQPTLSLRGKSLARNKDKLFPLMREMMLSVDFTDKERLHELLMQHFHALESSIQQNSLKYAVNLAASGMGVPSKILNRWYGLDYFGVIKTLFENFDADVLIAKMQQLQKQVLALEFPELVLSCDKKCYDQLKADNFYGLDEIPQRPSMPWKGDYKIETVCSQGRLIASPVAFTTMLFSSVPYSHPDAPALSIAAEIMLNQTLHKRIREQGGAYGSGAVNSALSGQFYLYAFRDPNLKSSLEAFREGIEKIASGDFGEKEIEEAKLGIFQDIDSPVSPSNRADLSYFRKKGGRTNEKRQAYRDRLLAANKEIIQCAVQSHLIPGLEQEITVTFAGKEFFEKEESELPLFPV